MSQTWQQRLLATFLEKGSGVSIAQAHIGHRVWDALVEVNFLDFNPWDPYRHATTKDGCPVYVHESFVGERIEVVTSEDLDALERVKGLILSTMRETGERPEAIEMGTDIWERFRAARLGSEHLFHEGVPILLDPEEPAKLNAKRNERPPEWCHVGACVLQRGSLDVWATIIGIQHNLVILDEVGDERHVPVFVETIRLEWEPTTVRVRVRDRFARVLDDL